MPFICVLGVKSFWVNKICNVAFNLEVFLSYQAGLLKDRKPHNILRQQEASRRPKGTALPPPPGEVCRGVAPPN